MKPINQLVYSIVSIFAIVSACAALPINVASIGESLIKSNNIALLSHNTNTHTHTHTYTLNAFLSGHICTMHFYLYNACWTHTLTYTYVHRVNGVRHNHAYIYAMCAWECWVFIWFIAGMCMWHLVVSAIFRIIQLSISFLHNVCTDRHATSKRDICCCCFF